MSTRRELLAVPDFRRYWASRVVSMLGSSVTYVALPVLVYRMTGSAGWVGLVTALDTIPFVLFGLLGGALGDRLDRRRLMVCADVAAAAAIGSVPLAAALGTLTLAHLMTAAFIAASACTIFDGANWGAVPMLVGRNRLPAANSLVYGAVSLVDTAGPALVGLALAVVSPGSLLVVDAASFAASALLIRAISQPMSAARTAPVTATSVRDDIIEGVRYLWRHPQLRPMTGVTMCGSAGAAALLAVMVVWSSEVLGSGTSGVRFGILYGLWGLGGLAAAALLPKVMARADALVLSRLVIPVVVLAAGGLCLARRYEVAAPLLLVYVLAHTVQFTAVVTWRQQVIPERLLSRVASAARLLGWGAAATVGALVAGPLAQAWGVRGALVLVVVLHLAGFVMCLQPALRTAVAVPSTGAAP